MLAENCLLAANFASNFFCASRNFCASSKFYAGQNVYVLAEFLCQ